MLRALVVWLLAAACLGWAVVRLLGLERGYPLVPLIAFTPFVAAGAAAIVLLALLLRQRSAALLAAVATLVLVAVVAPRALGGPSAPEGGRPAAARGDGEHAVRPRLGRGAGGARAAQPRRRAERAGADAGAGRSPRRGRARRADARARGRSAAGRQRDGPLLACPARAARDHPAHEEPDAGRLTAARGRAAGRRRRRARGAADSARASMQWRADLRALPPATPDGRLRILAGDFNATLDHAELRRSSTPATRTPPPRSAPACTGPGRTAAGSRRPSRSTTCSSTSASASERSPSTRSRGPTTAQSWPSSTHCKRLANARKGVRPLRGESSKGVRPPYAAEGDSPRGTAGSDAAIAGDCPHAHASWGGSSVVSSSARIP